MGKAVDVGVLVLELATHSIQYFSHVPSSWHLSVSLTTVAASGVNPAMQEMVASSPLLPDSLSDWALGGRSGGLGHVGSESETHSMQDFSHVPSAWHDSFSTVIEVRG